MGEVIRKSEMGLSVLGMGWVTSHGCDLETVWERILAQKSPALNFISAPAQGLEAPLFRVAVSEDTNFARLRRSSAISHFACAAASIAMAEAGPLLRAKPALLFATTHGSVAYTRRFYADVVQNGTGSPLLFPETVYNAPASHVAAQFGIDGPALTFVSDATAGTDALRAAAEMISSGATETCLIVSAEEADWMTWNGCQRWGLARSSMDSHGGAVLSEGAVALVVGKARESSAKIEFIHPGLSYHRSQPLASSLERLLQDLLRFGVPELAVTSASGTRIDRIESRAYERTQSGIRQITPKKYLGEAFAVSTVVQVVCGLLAIRDHLASRVIASVIGWNGQLGGLSLTRGEEAR